MFKRWLRRKTENEPQGPTPWVSHDALPADVRAWAEAVDVSRLPDRTVQEAEYYLKTYRFVPMLDRQELASRLMSVIHTHVDPPPPLDAHPLDVFATVLALGAGNSASAEQAPQRFISAKTPQPRYSRS